MTIEEIKSKIENNTIETGLYSSGSNKIVEVYETGFVIITSQDNGWNRYNYYDYDGTLWTESETYQK